MSELEVIGDEENEVFRDKIAAGTFLNVENSVVSVEHQVGTKEKEVPPLGNDTVAAVQVLVKAV